MLTTTNSNDVPDANRPQLRASATQPIHPVLDAQRKSWNRFSSGWAQWDEFTMDFLRPQGTAILDALDVADGSRVLDVATGTGDPGLSLAEDRPNVQVTALDASAGMLAIADAKARARGATNYATVLGDACALPFAPQAFDAVSCRLGFMFFPEPEVAAREMARVLRPGGVLATTVWAAPKLNPWVGTIVRIVKEHLAMPTPPPNGPGLFRHANAEAFAGLLESAGFSVEEHRTLEGDMVCASADQYWRFMNEVVPPIVAAMTTATPSQAERVEREVFDALMRDDADGPAPLRWTTHLLIARRP